MALRLALGALQGWEGTGFAPPCWQLSASTSVLQAQGFPVPEEVRHSAAMTLLEERGDSAQGDPDLSGPGSVALPLMRVFGLSPAPPCDVQPYMSRHRRCSLCDCLWLAGRLL